jgi:hypothetical protein
MNAKQIKSEIAALKREMKAAGIRVTSCFNGGLTREESWYNSQLFRLKAELLKAESQ